MTIDLESLGLTDLIRLRERLSETLVGRFERMLAVACVQPVGADPDARRHGTGAMRRALAAPGVPLVTIGAGDLVACFASADLAVAALVDAEQHLTPDEQLAARVSVVWGPVLTDGTIVTGDAVTLAARIAASGAPGEIRLSRSAYVELSSRHRLRCQPMAALELKGHPRPVEIVLLEWRQKAALPAVVRIAETGAEIVLPDRPTTTFGRVSESDSMDGSIIPLSLPNRADLQRISRRHFELRRQLDELYFYALTDNPCEVDGQPVTKGQRARVTPGSVARIAGVLTLNFLADPSAHKGADETVLQTVAVMSRPKRSGEA
jgi:class 3 adenylate cyclase